MKRVGILTGGGDCPGLNQVIRAVVMRLVPQDYEIVGFLEGWRGVLEQTITPLTIPDVDDNIREGGTMLGSSRTNPYKNEANDVPEDEGLATVEALLAAGAAVSPADNRGRTALMIAAGRGHAAIATRLIAAGADLHARDNEGKTATDLAASDEVNSVLVTGQ